MVVGDPNGPSQPAAFDFLKSLLPDIPPELQPLQALAYDIDAFEKDIDLFAGGLGIPAAELRERASEARSGSDLLAKKRARQHVVTRALLADWCTGTSRDKGDQLIWPCSLTTGPEARIDPAYVGIVPDYIKVDSERTEMTWELIETTIRDVVAQLEGSPNLRDPALVKRVRKIVALHWARSFETLEAVEGLCTQTIAANKAFMRANPELVNQRYRLKMGDPTVIPSSPEREAFIEEFAGRAEWIFTSGAFFRRDVIYLLRRAQEEWAHLQVQILRAPSGSEFLIGDSPVVKMDDTGHRRGPEHPITVGDATSVLMPMSPRITVVLDNLPRDTVVTAADVRRYNTWQLEAARERTFMHPTATALMAWVERTRPPTEVP